MPSDKRARKRANKQARQAELDRERRRRQMIRRGALAAVAVAAAIGIYFATSGSSTKPTKTAGATTSSSSSGSSSSSSATSSSSSATSSTGTDTQAAMDKIAVAAGCPSNPKTALKKPTYSLPPLTISAAKTYTATVQTDVGTFTMALDAASAPTAVNSFVFLANHGFFNCIIFHRVIPGFVVQGGDPTGSGSGGPGYQFTEHGPAPAANPAQQYPLGSVAMANSNAQGDTNPNTNGSQFFIVTGTQGESLPPDYVLFGHVTSGMSVVQKISQDGTSTGTPNVIHRMLKVTVATS